LGKDKASSLLSPAIAQITWVLKDAPEGYEHFFTPFILTVDLHNSVAHSDYSKRSRIIVMEYNNRVIFQNAGGFIPDSIEEVIRHNSPQDYYRNPFLVAAMVNFNMIDTVGSGIKKMFTIQKERYFPMPTYDITNETHTRVTIHGELINENYSRLLFKHPELSLEEVIALDKVQKKQEITEQQISRLRELKFIKGRSSSLQIVGLEKPVVITNKDYKQMIINLLSEKESVQREEIEKLIMPFLPSELPVEKRQKKISNILVELSTKEKKIKNVSSSIKYSIWKLNKD
jgi:ATP-dependent DNA helicase RecG